MGRAIMVEMKTPQMKAPFILRTTNPAVIAKEARKEITAGVNSPMTRPPPGRAASSPDVFMPIKAMKSPMPPAKP